jgi:hypothetical protein
MNDNIFEGTHGKGKTDATLARKAHQKMVEDEVKASMRRDPLKWLAMLRDPNVWAQVQEAMEQEARRQQRRR